LHNYQEDPRDEGADACDDKKDADGGDKELDLSPTNCHAESPYSPSEEKLNEESRRGVEERLQA